MTEKIFPFSDSDKESLPFQTQWRNELVKLSGGQIQTTFLHPRQGVLHISPSFSEDLNIQEMLVCNRWVDPNKGGLIATIQNGMSSNLVTVPNVMAFGEVRTPTNTSHSYWIENNLGGKPLNNVLYEGKPCFDIYEKLVKWMTVFHEALPTKINLRLNYQKRLGSIENIINNDESLRLCLGDERRESLFKLIHIAKSNVDLAIDDTEFVDRVHGDLRGNNVFVNGDHMSVFDFEQGVYGGDWYYDLEKLLLIERNEQFDKGKPYLYLPNLKSDQKYRLVDTYCKARSLKGWVIPTVLKEYLVSKNPNKLSKRKELYDIENALSMIVYRHLMGWDYSVSADGNQRGVNFIADFIIQNYNGVISQKNI